ncbi:MAG: phosphatase PAP2 family protein [Actinomycetota bacterium]|nr:phosphatase PAP2 family protein [Actinomycetota bacterium]
MFQQGFISGLISGTNPRQREIALLSAVQRRIAVPQVVTAARGLSFFGEHALGWLALGALGALIDRRRRRDWLASAAAVAAAHGTSIAVKRVVRRQRPTDPSVEVLAGTPSQLSFPSSHAASTTAAAVLYGDLLRRRLTPALVLPMVISRLVLGVHYPSDVLVGSALGAVIGAGMRRRLRGRVGGRVGGAGTDTAEGGK